MNPVGDESFDLTVGRQLRRYASAQSGPSPLPAQARYHGAFMKGRIRLPLVAKVGALVTTKAAIALSAGILVVGATSAGETVITGSINPSDWGKQVVIQVEGCKAALVPGSHGIGQCVSSFASQHGKQRSAEHHNTPTSAKGARTPAKGDRTAGPPSREAAPSPPAPRHRVHASAPPKKTTAQIKRLIATSDRKERR